MAATLPLSLALVLIAWFWFKRPQQAPRTQTDADPRYLTRAQLEEELAQFRKQTQWLLDEWYEKFSTLHARSEKQVQRARRAQQQGGAPVADVQAPAVLPSVLQHRKPWSV